MSAFIGRVAKGIFAWAAAGGTSGMLLSSDSEQHSTDGHNEDEDEVSALFGIELGPPELGPGLGQTLAPLFYCSPSSTTRILSLLTHVAPRSRCSRSRSLHNFHLEAAKFRNPRRSGSGTAGTIIGMCTGVHMPQRSSLWTIQSGRTLSLLR